MSNVLENSTHNQISPISKARTLLLTRHVFWSTLVLSTQFVINDKIPTAATDMTKIYYSSKFIATLDVDTVIFVIVHEVAHIMFKHGLRCGNRNRKVWNWACDYAINWMLQKAGFKLWTYTQPDGKPGGCLIDAKYANMSAEQIYDILIKNVKVIKVPPGLGGLDGDLMEVDLDPQEEARIDHQINQIVAQAASIARAAGKFPAELDLLVDGIINPPLPWNDLLRDFMLKRAPYGETWMKRDRRFPNIYMPSKKTGAMGELVLIDDTSGSMCDPKTFAQLQGELQYAMEFVRPERIRVVFADDTDCSHMEVFEQGELVEIHPKGGGGTDMRKPMQFVEQFNPIAVVIFTDCYTPWPEEAPNYPLITISTTDSECPHGQTIHIYN